MLEKNNLAIKRCLVTGGAGFVGFHLSRRLMLEGISILVVDNLNEYYDPKLKQDRINHLYNLSKKAKLKKSDFDFVNVDLRDKFKVLELIKEFKPDSICHLAAQAGVRYSLEEPNEYIDNNIVATMNILEASRNYGVSNIIFSSTSSVYGLNDNIPFLEDLSINSTISTYSSTKYACELLLHTYNHLYGIKVRILRFFTVYGPWGRPDMAFFKFTRAILSGDQIKVYNNGKMKRDFTYVSDIIDGFILALKSKSNFEIYNLGSGKFTNLMDFIEVIEQELGIDAKKEFLPLQPGDVIATSADISKARKELGYEPKISIKEGIANFVSWYKTYYQIK